VPLPGCGSAPSLAVGDGQINIGRGPAERPDLVLATDPATLEELAFMGLGLKEAERTGRVTVGGDRTLLPRLLRAFAFSSEVVR
jgi:hypothetical protein